MFKKTILSLMFIASTSSAGQIPKLFIDNPQLSCKAAKQLIGGGETAAGDVQIRLDSGDELLVEVEFSQNPKSNFKFGKRFAGGRDLTGKDKHNCRYFFTEESTHAAQAKYSCSELGEPSPLAKQGISHLFYRSSRQSGVVCKAPGVCWKITNCK